MRTLFTLTFLLLSWLPLQADPQEEIAGPFTLPLADRYWRVMIDPAAPWKDDPIFLPEDVDLAHLPIHLPTGGWGLLTDPASEPISLILPSTAEEFAWGLAGRRPYTKDEYLYADTDHGVTNGAYIGVSWWWKDILVPASFAQKQVVLLHIRGARQRAEVFVNQHLVGYSILAETPFDCDVTKALQPGKLNRVCIRITNPGGNLDGNDGSQITWGAVKLPSSHGFGGLDRGVLLEAHDACYITDSWALNTDDPHAITAHATVKNTSNQPVTTFVQFSVVDPRNGAVLANTFTQAEQAGQKTGPSYGPITLLSGKSIDVSAPISCPDADLWTLGSPHLYTLRTELVQSMDKTEPASEQRARTFGFRSFGIPPNETKAGFYLNGQRIRLYTALSWGFWGWNGLWPTPALAEKEVASAKVVGLNCLTSHRSMAKEEVLDQQDKQGLLRYLEPGGGAQVLGDLNAVPNTTGNGSPTTFAKRYEADKILAMVREFRSHPSVVTYQLQNEEEGYEGTPQMNWIRGQMNDADPSRIILTIPDDGQIHLHVTYANPSAPTVTPTPSAFPWDNSTGFSDWQAEHAEGGPGVWKDEFAAKYLTGETDPRNSVNWQLLGAPSPDNHALMLEQINARPCHKSYDLDDHVQMQIAYRDFLNKWKFRAAFPTDADFYRSAGAKTYEYWGRVLELARFRDDHSIFSIASWDSTAIANHSGLVDSLRNFKADPALIRDKLAPILPVVEPRRSILRPGETTTVDLYLINETGQPVTDPFVATLTDPSGQTQSLGSFPTPALVPDQFAYPIKLGLDVPTFTVPGTYRFDVTLGALHNSQTVQVYSTDGPVLPGPKKIGFLENTNPDATKELLAKWPNLTVEPWKPDGKYDLLVANFEKSSQPQNVLSDAVLAEVSAGTPLLILASDPESADSAARRLADAKAIIYKGFVPGPRATDMGNWVFVREHPCYDGLPVNEVMKGDYQIPAIDSFGLMIDGNGVEVIAGYGRDHDRNVGAATFTCQLGQGTVLFQAVTGMQPAMSEHWLGQAVQWLLTK